MASFNEIFEFDNYMGNALIYDPIIKPEVSYKLMDDCYLECDEIEPMKEACIKMLSKFKLSSRII